MAKPITLPFSPREIFYNLSYDELFEHEVHNKETRLCDNNCMAVDTGIFTGRSPKDKFFVDQAPSNQNIGWGAVNQRTSAEVFDTLYEEVNNYLHDKKVYITDAFAGAGKTCHMPVRIISELAWQAHFCKNMFIEPTDEELLNFTPEFTIINASGLTDINWQKHGLNSEVFVLFNIEKKCAIIGGTSYGGEMKKGIFSILNYHMPLKGILTMHCSANSSKSGTTTLFFGLSGTGKTTLSTDPHRFLIGDDEHGWDDHGIFNLEGGCYAKTIGLKEETEPDIYHAIKRNALLENVVIDPKGHVDYQDNSKTENTRVSYPIDHIENIVKPISTGKHPEAIIFLSCDAFGVLPPVARLSKEQAMYYFLSGYTAKVAGTERGIKEPVATFSPCFGGPFLSLPPTAYSDLLGKKIDAHETRVYLVNTGWGAGGYHQGDRMPIPLTRTIIDAILNSSIEKSDFNQDPIFGFDIPQNLGEIDPAILNPCQSWASPKEYQEKATELAKMFRENFMQYQDSPYKNSGPKV